MKKRILTVLCAMTLALGISVSASAEAQIPSPSAKPVEEKGSPATGENNTVIYGLAAAVLLAGTAVISKKQLEEA